MSPWLAIGYVSDVPASITGRNNNVIKNVNNDNNLIWRRRECALQEINRLAMATLVAHIPGYCSNYQDTYSSTGRALCPELPPIKYHQPLALEVDKSRQLQPRYFPLIPPGPRRVLEKERALCPGTGTNVNTDRLALLYSFFKITLCMADLADRLGMMGAEIGDDDQIDILLASLPISYKPLKTTLCIQLEKLNLTNVHSAILDEAAGVGENFHPLIGHSQRCTFKCHQPPKYRLLGMNNYVLERLRCVCIKHIRENCA